MDDPVKVLIAKENWLAAQLELYGDPPPAIMRPFETFGPPPPPEDGEVPVPLEDSLRNMAVIEAIFRSADSGRWESTALD